MLRLRSDIFWAARRWRESAEQIELYYGDRWRDFKPLNAVEKSDIIRAAVGYALADDSIGMSRFREKYAPLMSESADQLAFDIASKPAGASSAEFAAIAKMAASVDTLDGFLREMKLRFPDATARAPASPQAKDRVRPHRLAAHDPRGAADQDDAVGSRLLGPRDTPARGATCASSCGALM